MTERKRDAPIPAENVDSPRPWRLPFWTETPVHSVEREEHETNDAEPYGDGSDGDEGIAFPTAEELEAIRREAYNAGLEQGLIEGRQQGHREGLELGRNEGQQEGREQGYQVGHQEGVQAGFHEGKALGATEADNEAQQLRQTVRALQASLKERDQHIPDAITALLAHMLDAVLQHELKSGAAAISHYVDQAMALLPDGETLAKIWVSPSDHALLDARHLNLPIHVDSALEAGQCRVESEHSLVEYAVSEHAQQALMSMAEAILVGADGFTEDPEWQAGPPEPEPEPEPQEASETPLDLMDLSPKDDAHVDLETSDEHAESAVSDAQTLDQNSTGKDSSGQEAPETSLHEPESETASPTEPGLDTSPADSVHETPSAEVSSPETESQETEREETESASAESDSTAEQETPTKTEAAESPAVPEHTNNTEPTKGPEPSELTDTEPTTHTEHSHHDSEPPLS